MRKPVLVLVLVISVCSIKAQSPYSSMSQDQLNFLLVRANNKINAGMTLTFTGAVVEIAGIVLFANGVKKMDESEVGTGGLLTGTARTVGGLIVMAGGLGLMGSGIPIWAVGASKKKKIDLELIKFRSPGSASAYGVGLRIYF